jgi:hypothetical protein
MKRALSTVLVAVLAVVSLAPVSSVAVAADRRPQLARAAIEELIDRVDIILERVQLTAEQTAQLIQAVQKVRESMRVWDLNAFGAAIQRFAEEVGTLVVTGVLSPAQGQGIVDGVASVLQYLADIGFVPQSFATAAIGSVKTGYDIKISR